MTGVGLTAVALLAGLALWVATGWLVTLAGLDRFDLLARVLLLFPLLGLLDRAIDRGTLYLTRLRAKGRENGHEH